MERFEKIWVSSEKHLENFQIVKKNKKILINTLDPKTDRRFYDFPRTHVSGNIFPVIFENLGHLIVSDNGIQFYKNDYGLNNNFQGINKGENIFISYEEIIKIELVKSSSSFISYFNNTWIKILFNSSGMEKDVLLSNSGQGFVMKKIRKKNSKLLEIIKSKMK